MIPNFSKLLSAALVVVLLSSCAPTAVKHDAGIAKDKSYLETKPTPLTPLTEKDVAVLKKLVGAGRNGPQILKILNETGMSFERMKSVMATGSALLVESQLAKASQQRPESSRMFGEAPKQIKTILVSGLGEKYESSKALMDRSGLDLSQFYTEGDRQ